MTITGSLAAADAQLAASHELAQAREHTRVAGRGACASVVRSRQPTARNKALPQARPRRCSRSARAKAFNAGRARRGMGATLSREAALLLGVAPEPCEDAADANESAADRGERSRRFFEDLRHLHRCRVAFDYAEEKNCPERLAHASAVPRPERPRRRQAAVGGSLERANSRRRRRGCGRPRPRVGRASKSARPPRRRRLFQ